MPWMKDAPKSGLRSKRKVISAMTLALAAAFMTVSPDALALGTKQIVDLDNKHGAGVVLARASRAAPIVVGKDDFPGVLRAARDLQRDVGRVTGKTPQWIEGNPTAASDVILIGTLGRNPVIDQLVKDGKIDTRDLAGQWEGFVIQTVDNPMPGVQRALVIAATSAAPSSAPIRCRSRSACRLGTGGRTFPSRATPP
jgi:hypothetical protein